MPLIKNKAFIRDNYTMISDEMDYEQFSNQGIIVSLTRLKNETAILKQHTKSLGVLLHAGEKSGDDVRELIEYMCILDLIAIEFPTFRNGRGYSNARILREELHFTGEIRALGDVSYDQWFFMTRCGIDVFDVSEDITIQQFKDALDVFDDAYQPASDNQQGILWHR